MLFRLLALAFLAHFTLAAQAPAGEQFQTFTVKTAAPNKVRGSVRIKGDTLEGLNVTLKQLIGYAYGRDETYIIGPAWMDTAAYDLSAKAPPPADPARMRAMLQDLLRRHFSLDLRYAKQNFSGYALRVAKTGPRLRPTSAQATSNPTFKPGFAAIYSNKNLPEFAERLSRAIGAPVIDLTKIKGRYWFELEWANEEDKRGVASPSLLRALAEQLGLTLESRDVLADVIAIDRVERR